MSPWLGKILKFMVLGLPMPPSKTLLQALSITPYTNLESPPLQHKKGRGDCVE